jgi:hypothetical protein
LIWNAQSLFGTLANRPAVWKLRSEPDFCPSACAFDSRPEALAIADSRMLEPGVCSLVDDCRSNEGEWSLGVQDERHIELAGIQRDIVSAIKTRQRQNPDAREVPAKAGVSIWVEPLDQA